MVVSHGLASKDHRLSSCFSVDLPYPDLAGIVDLETDPAGVVSGECSRSFSVRPSADAASAQRT